LRPGPRLRPPRPAPARPPTAGVAPSGPRSLGSGEYAVIGDPRLPVRQVLLTPGQQCPRRVPSGDDALTPGHRSRRRAPSGAEVLTHGHRSRRRAPSGAEVLTSGHRSRRGSVWGCGRPTVSCSGGDRRSPTSPLSGQILTRTGPDPAFVLDSLTPGHRADQRPTLVPDSSTTGHRDDRRPRRRPVPTGGAAIRSPVVDHPARDAILVEAAG
jgi:hypothetical protein